MPLSSIEQVAGQAFDYVVIGGGTAGLTVAARLSEDPNVSVAVLEAGAPNFDHPLIKKSAQNGFQFGNASLDWAFQTTPQKHGLDVVYNWNRGRGLSGSSAMNFQMWVHPPKQDIDNWERLGNPGWNFDDWLKYANRAINVDKSKTEVDGFKIWDVSKSYGTGPLDVSLPNSLDADIKMREVLQKCGVPKASAPYHGDPNGLYLCLGTYEHNTFYRSHSATAYLRPNLDRPNLVVLPSALVHKVILEDGPSGVTATGVQFSVGDNNEQAKASPVYVVNAKKEVILSAGSLKSPQLLELSGIGRSDVLKKIGVPVKVDLPGVGENVQEHQIACMAFELKEDSPDQTFDIIRDPQEYERQAGLITQGKGVHTLGITSVIYQPLSLIAGMPLAKELYATQKAKIQEGIKKGEISPALEEQYNLLLSNLDPEKGHPDIEILGYPGFISFPKPPLPGKRYYTICGALNHNFSRGTIHATSDDPFANPEMDPHYFENEIETQGFVNCVKFIRKLAETAPLKDSIAQEHCPGPECQTDEQINEWVKKGSITVFHTIGSCSMLPREKNGVVDPNLKVYGTTNLRVADISIVPLHIAAHTQSTAYVIGEKAADILKGAA